MSSLLYDINLVLQVVTIIMLLVARSYARKKRFRTHGILMTTATAMHTIAILLIMVPSFARYFGILIGPPTLGVVITWVHAAAGMVAAVVAIFVVTRWRFQKSTAACARRRKLMEPLLYLWGTALVLGIGFYIYYYILHYL
jgi:hypothetical protein